MGETGYKYIRATFSNALKSLSKADIEIRNVKTEQLYSVEDVALSTDGYTADITIAGNTADAGTTFLMPSTIYSCKMSSDGLDATLEFQLPDVWSDMLVTSVDVEKNTITVYGSVRKGGQFVDYAQTFNVGDTYDGNLGELVGHTVVVGLDADNNITSMKVNDGEVAFGYVTAKDGDNDGDFDSSKDYFETASGDKYYLSTTYTSSTNYSMYVWANNKGGYGRMIEGGINKGNTFEYGKLVLNPNGTVSAAVLWPAFDGYIFATTADGSVAKETSNNSKDFKGYTVIDGETLNYVDPTDISDGDIIYYSTANKLAFIYNNNASGTLETVYDDKLEIDGTKYNYIVWRENFAHQLPGAKNAKYYDADNDEYKLVTEKWANTLDKTEPVTIFLDTKGDGVLVEGTVGETVTHSKDYIITKSPKAYKNGLAQMMDLAVSDGTEVTLHIAAEDITSINGDAFGDVTFSAVNTPADTTVNDVYDFDINDGDGKKTANVNGKDKTNAVDNLAGDGPVNSTVFQQGGLVTVIYNSDETKVTGLKIKLGAKPVAATEITMKQHKDVSLTPGLASIKTTTAATTQAPKDGSLTLSDSTKVYVITGSAMPANETPHDDGYKDDTPYVAAQGNNAAKGGYKEASDNKVKVYNYSDFDQATQAGNAALEEYVTNVGGQQPATTKKPNTANPQILVGSRIRFIADKTAATEIIIDNRGINNGLDNTQNTKDKLGAADGKGDYVGGGVFKDADTTTKILGVATATEYQTNSDGTTPQLASLTILTVDGSITLDSFKEKTDDDQNAKNKIVLAELDATGKVTKLTEGANAAAAPEVDVVNWGAKVPSSNTDVIEVTATGGPYNLRQDDDCLVVMFDGSSYSETSIGEINRDTSYTGIKFWTSQLNGTDVKAKVIVATKTPNAASYTATLTSATFTLGNLTATSFKTPNAAVAIGSFSLKDQIGAAFTTQGASATLSNITLGGATVTPGATTIVATANASTANPSVVTVTNGSTAGYTAVAGDTMTTTFTDTNSNKSFKVTLTYDGNYWTAGDVTALP